MGYRHTAVFVSDWRKHSRVLDRNERARILALAEALERRSKPAGRRNGLLGYVGLAVLRALMFGFLSRQTGLCCPSYMALQCKTGLCRQSIANGLARLERTGIARIVRRLQRERVRRDGREYTGTTQATSLYSLQPPGAWAEHLPRQTERRAPFPDRRQLDLLQIMALRWSVSPKLSPAHRREPQNPGSIIARLMRG